MFLQLLTHLHRVHCRVFNLPKELFKEQPASKPAEATEAERMGQQLVKNIKTAAEAQVQKAKAQVQKKFGGENKKASKKDGLDAFFTQSRSVLAFVFFARCHWISCKQPCWSSQQQFLVYPQRVPLPGHGLRRFERCGEGCESLSGCEGLEGREGSNSVRKTSKNLKKRPCVKKWSNGDPGCIWEGLRASRGTPQTMRRHPD